MDLTINILIILSVTFLIFYAPKIRNKINVSQRKIRILSYITAAAFLVTLLLTDRYNSDYFKTLRFIVFTIHIVISRVAK